MAANPNMQTLRDWLPFTRTDTAEDAPIPEAWRLPLAGLDPVAKSTELRRQLIIHLELSTNPHARLKLLEATFQESVGTLPVIEALISRADLPLPSDVLQAALAADNLLKSMAAGYIGVIESLRAQKVPASASHLIRVSTLRAVQCLVNRQQLACRAYAPASPNTWQQLHAIYAYARQQGLGHYSNGGRTLEAEYIGGVLLAYADPTKFSRQDLVPLIECASHFASQVQIRGANSIAPNAARSAQFLIQESDRHPGKRLRTAPPEEWKQGWVVDCIPMVATLSALIARRQQNLPDDPGDPATPTGILQKSLNMWRGQRGRRFARQSFKPRGELVTGLSALILALDTDVVAEGSEWAILDESPDGFGLRYLRGNATELQVGELVGLRPRERERLHVCLIRRVVNAGAARLELGLQEIAPIAFPVPIPNEHATKKQALFFPTMPAHRGISGALARTGELHAGVQLNIAGHPAMSALRPIETDERYELWELTTR